MDSAVAKNLNSFFSDLLSPRDRENAIDLFADYLSVPIEEQNDDDDDDDELDELVDPELLNDDSINYNDDTDMITDPLDVSNIPSNNERQDDIDSNDRERQDDIGGCTDSDNEWNDDNIDGPLIDSPRLVVVDLASTTQVLDMNEKDKIVKFINDGCGCNIKCSTRYDEEYYSTTRDSCTELTRNELDIFVMGQLSASVFDSSNAKAWSRHTPTPRQRPKSIFHHRGQKMYDSAIDHLKNVAREREVYKNTCKKSKLSIESDCTISSMLMTTPSLSRDYTVHYSFDYAQQIHYPSHPQQVGPIYFLTPRKCAIFGMCCEGIPKQVNYLIDEAVDTGKGGNTVASMIHHFFATHGLGEKRVHLHADNCVGQNKNNYIMQYLIWRVLVGLHEDITLSFLPVGHTKFSPDWCFGLLKKKFRKSVVYCLDDLVNVVENSADVNTSQLVGTQSGEVIVPTYNWSEYFNSRFKKMIGIKKYHHFHFSSSKPGIVTVRESSIHEDTELQLWIDNPNHLVSVDILPNKVIPTGLSNDRQCYLYNSIRQFCSPETKDLVCPLPETIHPPPLTNTIGLIVTPTDTLPPPSKRQRKCGNCHKTGHNKATFKEAISS